MAIIRVLILLFFLSPLTAKTGTFINPFKDVCWECLLPITVGGVNVTPGTKDFSKTNKNVCVCAGFPPKVGIPLTFWEPLRLVDVTRHAYKLIGLGGISVGKETLKNRGSVGLVSGTSTRTSFYHVHVYQYPILAILELFTDFACVEKGELDVAYMSELDPLWNDDQLSAILDPEAALFNNPAAQIACIEDCATASMDAPSDTMFWCAGCQGSIYPFTGNVAHHVGAVQASSLLVHRIMAKLHRTGVVKGFGKNDFCEAKVMPVIKKSLYKTQLCYPIPQTKGSCHPLGKSDMLWGVGKSFPQGGEDFVYLLWSKKQCCLDSTKAAVGAGL